MNRICIICVAFGVLSGCGVPPAGVPQTLVVTKTVYVPWEFPTYLKVCAGDPGTLQVPHIPATDPAGGSKAARYTLALRAHDAEAIAAADDCRETLAAAAEAASNANLASAQH